MFNVLLVGSDGYIGQNLLCSLSCIRNLEVICVDKNNTTSYCDYDYISDVTLKDINACIFLAAMSGIKQCNDKPDDAITENVLKPIEFFSKLEKHNIFTVFSSSQAAKNPSSSLYAYSKRILEQKLLSQKNENVVLRFSNVFGGKNYLNKKDSVIAKFINDANKKGEITVNGDGDQIRNFVHVDQICSVIINFLFMKNIPEKWQKKPLDVGGKEIIKINEIAKIIKNLRTEISVKYNHERLCRYKNPTRTRLNLDVRT